MAPLAPVRFALYEQLERGISPDVVVIIAIVGYKISVQHALNRGKAAESAVAAAVLLPACKKGGKPKEPR
jgi:hypothetical protein